MEHKTHIVEELRKQIHSGYEIWQVYAILQNDFFIKKCYEKYVQGLF